VLLAILAGKECREDLGELEFRVPPDTRAVLAIPVFQGFKEFPVIKDLLVRPVSPALLEQPVKYFVIRTIYS